MATKTDFTEDEWQQLRLGVIDAGFLVSLSDGGILDSFKEANAMAKHLAAGRRDTESELVRELAAETPHGLKPTASPVQIEHDAVAHLQAAVACLGAKAPDELGHYRDFVLDVAESVAQAAHGVSAAERAELDAVRSALGVR